MKVINKSVIVKLIVSVLLISMIYIMCKNINNRKEVVLDDVVVKNNITNKKAFAIMLEQDNGEYIESESNTFPTSGYIFNSEKSGCVDINGNIIENSLAYEDNKVKVRTNKTSYCYVYFDIDNEPVWTYFGWGIESDNFDIARGSHYFLLRSNGSVPEYEDYDSEVVKVETCGLINDTMVCLNYNSTDLEEQCTKARGTYSKINEFVVCTDQLTNVVCSVADAGYALCEADDGDCNVSYGHADCPEW